MIKLDVKEYYKVKKPLKELKFNTLFAEHVIEIKIDGTIYVDDLQNPKAFYISHPYCMSLLFGDSENKDFLDSLHIYMTNKKGFRKTAEWLQVYPNAWASAIKDMLGSELICAKDDDISVYKINDKVIQSTRLNLKFSYDKYTALSNNLSSNEYEIVPTTKELYENLKGSVIPKYFWRDVNQFIELGKGYSLIKNGEIASTAFSSCVSKNQLEIGIETLKKYRGMGFARLVCSSLIEYCLQNNLEPVWSCNITNTGSATLAKKLGFVPSVTLPHYKLIV